MGSASSESNWKSISLAANHRWYSQSKNSEPLSKPQHSPARLSRSGFIPMTSQKTFGSISIKPMRTQSEFKSAASFRELQIPSWRAPSDGVSGIAASFEIRAGARWSGWSAKRLAWPVLPNDASAHRIAVLTPARLRQNVQPPSHSE